MCNLTQIQLSKTCTKCRVAKPLTEFYKDRRALSGLRSSCKACELIRTNAWRVANREHYNELAQLRSQSDKAKAQRRVRKKRWRERHPDKLKAERKRYRQRRKQRDDLQKQKKENSNSPE